MKKIRSEDILQWSAYQQMEWKTNSEQWWCGVWFDPRYFGGTGTFMGHLSMCLGNSGSVANQLVCRGMWWNMWIANATYYMELGVNSCRDGHASRSTKIMFELKIPSWTLRSTIWIAIAPNRPPASQQLLGWGLEYYYIDPYRSHISSCWWSIIQIRKVQGLFRRVCFSAAFLPNCCHKGAITWEAQRCSPRGAKCTNKMLGMSWSWMVLLVEPPGQSSYRNPLK